MLHHARTCHLPFFTFISELLSFRSFSRFVGRRNPHVKVHAYYFRSICRTICLCGSCPSSRRIQTRANSVFSRQVFSVGKSGSAENGFISGARVGVAVRQTGMTQLALLRLEREPSPGSDPKRGPAPPSSSRPSPGSRAGAASRRRAGRAPVAMSSPGVGSRWCACSPAAVRPRWHRAWLPKTRARTSAVTPDGAIRARLAGCSAFEAGPSMRWGGGSSVSLGRSP